jgi:hypothetical protein
VKSSTISRSRSGYPRHSSAVKRVSARKKR